MTESFEEADLIGKLTGYRCKECGCCLYFNSAGMTWCSSCDFNDASREADKSQFAYAPVPNDHPHIVLFGNGILDTPPAPTDTE